MALEVAADREMGDEIAFCGGGCGSAAENARQKIGQIAGANRAVIKTVASYVHKLYISKVSGSNSGRKVVNTLRPKRKG